MALAIAGPFWAANEFAWAYGAGKACNDAVGMQERPAIILVTRDRLPDRPGGISETVLPADITADPPEPARYRYEGLRLLLASGGRLYLVPQEWTADSWTTVVMYDENVRIQLVPSGQ